MTRAPAVPNLHPALFKVLSPLMAPVIITIDPIKMQITHDANNNEFIEVPPVKHKSHCVSNNVFVLPASTLQADSLTFLTLHHFLFFLLIFCMHCIYKFI